MSKIITNMDQFDDAWLNLGDTSKLKLNNPLSGRSYDDIENPGRHELRLMRNPNYLSFSSKYLCNIDLLPMQACIMKQLWTHSFPMLIATRGFSKSFLTALYAMLRCVLFPGTKIVIAGAAFRQSKVVFEYMENIWVNAPVFRSICSNASGPRKDTDRWSMHINDSWAHAIPLGDGKKIRGLRAHTVIMDEFSAIPVDIFETVIAGFTAVSPTPVDNVKERCRRNAMMDAGVWTQDNEERFLDKDSNQIILSGTADYDFKHFAQYWRRYKAIINTRGDPLLLKEIVGEENVKDFNWRDYCVIRIPYELIPKGFMDDKNVIRSRATMHSGIYGMEYGAVFIKDSSGFFKRSLIESCVADEDNVKKQYWPDWCDGCFDAMLRGQSGKIYVYGIDPASENDNFSLIVIELHEEHSRVVYCWSTNRKNFRSKLSAGLTGSHDFYGFAARKIRDLMKIFPAERIGIDAQGGGIALEEALHDPDKIEKGEIPLWPIVEDKEKDTDIYSGDHILEMCQFARAEWVAEANHGLRKDMEDKVLLFPRFDSITLGLANEEDKRKQDAFEKQNPGQKWDIYDSLEDCVMEIEELKNELSTIVMSKAGTGVSGRDRWDTPEIKLESGRKGRLRKDRYSALMIANMVARQIARTPKPIDYEVIGDFTSNIQAQEGKMYNGPEWFTKGTNDFWGYGIKR